MANDLARSGTRPAVLAVLALLTACYGSRDTDADDVMNSWVELDGAARTGSAGNPGIASPTKLSASGGAGCAAFRKPGDEGTFDTSAFTGIGGAGAMIAGTCKRCGWDAREDACQELVYGVPRVEDANYQPCFDLSYQYARCLEEESCVCGGSIPDKCAVAKTRVDACLKTGMSSPPRDADSGVPSDWVTVATKCGFKFKAPPNYREQPLQGTDSCVLQFTANDCDYFADYGAFSGALESDRPCGRGPVTIDGFEAEVMVCPNTPRAGHFKTGVHFPFTRKSMTRLTMTGTCPSGTASMESQLLYYSIRFSE
ncbi:MAG TPA: hypothetical protein VJV78_17785 [Polyangiales bacterium]|nr:hypothetical protein [Polyangiales bacterium]